MDADRKASMVSLVSNDPNVGCSAAEPLYFGVRGIVRGPDHMAQHLNMIGFPILVLLYVGNLQRPQQS